MGQPVEKLPLAEAIQNTREPIVRKSGKPRAGGIILFNGLALTINAWAARLGLEPSTLRMRFYMGWSLERALSNRCGCPGDRKRHPPRGRILEHDGRAMRVREWAEHLGISESVIRQRLKQGYPIEAVLTSGDRPGA